MESFLKRDVLNENNVVVHLIKHLMHQNQTSSKYLVVSIDLQNINILFTFSIYNVTITCEQNNLH